MTLLPTGSVFTKQPSEYRQPLPGETTNPMNERPTVIAIVTARGGSKRLPRKNLRAIGGKSLLSWTIEAAQSARRVSRTIVSSEDGEIIAAALAAGAEVPFIRPHRLATDGAASLDVVGHALDAVGEHYDMFVLLQPTSPLRDASDIDQAIQLCIEQRAPTCVSVSPIAKPFRWFYQLSPNSYLRSLVAHENNLPTMDQEDVILNGAIYVAQTDWFRRNQAFISPETVGYLMPRERSVDIDDELDLLLAEELLARRDAQSYAELTPKASVA